MPEGSAVDSSRGQFIDPLFAVIIAAAMSETIVSWAKLSNLPTLTEMFIVFIGYSNLLLSWFGYHKSVLREPILGSVRFVITVILLPLYLLTIILFEKDIIFICLVYSSIFFLWSTWEYFKSIEHSLGDKFWRLQFRWFNMIVYFSTVYSLLVYLLWKDNNGCLILKYSQEISIVLIAFAILALRISKSAGNSDSPLGKIKAEAFTLMFGRSNISAATPGSNEGVDQ